MDFNDWIAFELCGGFGDSAEIDCPHCGASISLDTDDADAEESYACDECGGEFIVDWSSRQIRW